MVHSTDKSLLAVLLVLFLVAGVKTLFLRSEAQRMLMQKETSKAGLGEQLKRDIDSLESSIALRLAYTVDPGGDPLDLNRVFGFLTARSGTKEYKEPAKKMRLSCTIVSPLQNRAIIKYKDRSYVVKRGDIVHGRRVIDITREKVTLEQQGRMIVLENEPAPRQKGMIARSRESEELEL
jgi:hypothetical protein